MGPKRADCIDGRDARPASCGREHDDGELRAAVVEVMARITLGDRDAVWDLHDLAEPALARILRAEARRIDVRLGDEDVFDLTLDAAIDLAKLAHSWRPDGALPWVWARRRIIALVHGHVGTFARELDETHLELEAPPRAQPAVAPREALRSLARRHPSAHRLDQCLSATVTERDADIWLGVQLEKAAGNRSPAVTVATDHGMRPDAVRKVVQRVGQRVVEVA
jgi:hypothetical protein